MMLTLPYVAFAYVGVLLIVAALYDFRYMIIPNFISAALILGFIFFAVVKNLSLEQWLWHFGISMIVFAVGFALFYLRAMGGGDVKLLAATSIWIGVESILPFVFLVSVIGAILGLMKLAHNAVLIWRAGKKLERETLFKSEIPYGIAIGLGAILAFPGSSWMN